MSFKIKTENFLATLRRESSSKMVKEDGKTKKRSVMESLGWLTKSSIMPKKHHAIVGVGASPIVDLKAQLYQS